MPAGRFEFPYLSMSSCLRQEGAPGAFARPWAERYPVAPMESPESEAGSRGPRLAEIKPCGQTKGYGLGEREDRKAQLRGDTRLAVSAGVPGSGLGGVPLATDKRGKA